VIEILHESIVIGTCDSVGKARDYLDVGLEWSLKQLVDDTIVVVVMTDAKKRVNVVPNSTAKRRRVYIVLVTHPDSNSEI